MENQLPAISGLNKAELQAAYEKETGKEAGDQTVEQLREALKAHREPAPAATMTASTTPTLTAGQGELVATHPEHGDRIFSEIAWANLADRAGERDGWEVKPAKPAPAAQ